jgi:hypothetical protein
MKQTIRGAKKTKEHFSHFVLFKFGFLDFPGTYLLICLCRQTHIDYAHAKSNLFTTEKTSKIGASVFIGNRKPEHENRTLRYKHKEWGYFFECLIYNSWFR